MLITKYWSSPLTPVRARSLHSMMIAASNAPSTFGAILMSGTPGNCMSGAGAGSALTTSASLPSARSAYAIASCDPIESPSGRACDDSTNRCRSWMACAMSLITGLLVIVWRRGLGVDLAEQLLDAALAGNRFVVVEGQFRRTLQAQARADLPAQKSAGARERAVGVAAALLVAERRVVDVGLLEIGRDSDTCQR